MCNKIYTLHALNRLHILKYVSISPIILHQFYRFYVQNILNQIFWLDSGRFQRQQASWSKLEINKRDAKKAYQYPKKN